MERGGFKKKNEEEVVGNAFVRVSVEKIGLRVG